MGTVAERQSRGTKPWIRTSLRQACDGFPDSSPTKVATSGPRECATVLGSIRRLAPRRRAKNAQFYLVATFVQVLYIKQLGHLVGEDLRYHPTTVGGYKAMPMARYRRHSAFTVESCNEMWLACPPQVQTLCRGVRDARRREARQVRGAVSCYASKAPWAWSQKGRALVESRTLAGSPPG